MPIRFPWPSLALSLLLAPLAHAAASGPDPSPAPPVVVREAYVSDDSPDDEFDSLATWTHPDGGAWLIATAKSSHRLVVFDADTGRRLREVGGRGTAPGRFDRPNGIAVHGDRVFVAERDNRRVQVLSLPDFRPLGSFGQDRMRAPYGLWLVPDGTDGLEVYVTDSFMDGARFDVVPPLDQLNQRVRHYRLALHPDGGFGATALPSFGDTGETTALRIVESIAGDARRRTLLIADEDRRRSTLREYRHDGRATGRSVPPHSFQTEAEGVALWTCGGRGGYWIAVDQMPALTTFRLFDRASLATRGGFTGAVVAQTDGIALRTAPSARFPAGALFAVHRDRAVAAFDLRGIAAAMKLRGCV